ncbi:hypothetical protein OUZ56_029067 [Daphnia magna]|uniref:Uncharacterized protein n=1 Tax=Daphnia magna TaxID=35525 RepID=A0ABR0B5R1_9CRUS|nr:hypothetical protein OUZ56_029067 [Daphnia magna]
MPRALDIQIKLARNHHTNHSTSWLGVVGIDSCHMKRDLFNPLLTMKYSFIIHALQVINICLLPLASTSRISKQLLLLPHQAPYYPSTDTQYPTMQQPVGPFFGYFPNFMSPCSPCPLCPATQSCPVSPVTCPSTSMCSNSSDTSTSTTTPSPITCPTCPTCATPPPAETIRTCDSGLNSAVSSAPNGTVLVDIATTGVSFICQYAFVAYPPHSKIALKCNTLSAGARFWVSPVSLQTQMGVLGIDYTSTGSHMIMTANNLLNKIGMKLQCTWTGIL